MIVADDRGALVANGAGEVAAIAPDGRAEWRARLNATDDESIFDPPAMDESLVAVPVDESRVVALDRGAGTERWRVPFPGAVLVAVDASRDGSDVVVASADGHVASLAGADGTVRWSIDLPFGTDPLEPRVWHAGSHVLVAWTKGRMHLRAFDSATGQPVWSRAFKGLGSMPIVESRTLTLAVNLRRAGRDHAIGQFRQYDIATGALRWKSREIRERGFLPTFLTAAARGYIAAADVSGDVVLVRARSGRIVWRSGTGKEQYENAPWIVGPVVAMTTYGTGLVALSMADGSPVETGGLDRGQTAVIFEATAAASDRLYVLISGTGDFSEMSEIWMLAPSS